MAKIAMVDHSTGEVLRVFGLPEDAIEVPVMFELPNGDRVSPVVLGWASGDYAVLPVMEFVMPDGKVQSGAPTYEITGGSVAETIPVEDAPVVRPLIAKTLVQQRLIEAGLMEAAYAALTSNAVYFARWFAPGHAEVYADDPDALALLTAIGADPAVIMAVD